MWTSKIVYDRDSWRTSSIFGKSLLKYSRLLRISDTNMFLSSFGAENCNQLIVVTLTGKSPKDTQKEIFEENLIVHFVEPLWLYWSILLQMKMCFFSLYSDEKTHASFKRALEELCPGVRPLSELPEVTKAMTVYKSLHGREDKRKQEAGNR